MPSSAAAAKMTAAEIAAANERTIATLFDGLPAPPQAWNAIVFHHSATAGGSKARFDVGHRRKFNDPDGMEYHFLIGSGVGSADGLIEVGDRWRRQIIAYHLFTRARDAGSIAIRCIVVFWCWASGGGACRGCFMSNAGFWLGSQFGPKPLALNR